MLWSAFLPIVPTAGILLGMSAPARSLPSYMVALPYHNFAPLPQWRVPSLAECEALWDSYAMMDHIRDHSRQVAAVAVALAQRAASRGIAVDIAAVQASALLHDIAKSYTIRHGGSHAQLGAAWVVAETQHQAIAQAVRFHVHWPWDIPTDSRVCSLPFFVLYADKRIKHDQCVTLQERFEDLLYRYGSTEKARNGIELSHQQGLNLERALAGQLEWDIHACTLDCGRLV